MKIIEVKMVRVYFTENSKLLKPTMDYLKNEIKIRGFSIFRAIGGFGETGMHTSSLVDLSLDLPIVIEFFDRSEKVDTVLQHLNSVINVKHMVVWTANANE